MNSFSLAVLLVLLLASVASGQNQYQGGRKRRKKFGINGIIQEGEQEITAKDLHEAGILTANDVRPEDQEELAKTRTQIVAADGNAGAESDDTRKPSMVKLPGRDQMLMLPDRESVLKFDFIRDFAKPEDVETQLEQRQAAWWGRLFVEDFPFSMQYLRGHFGKAPKMGPYTLLLAEPVIMCNTILFDAALDNVAKVKELKDQGQDVLLVARRGNCTFGEKSILAEEVGAAGIIFVNDEDGVSHPAAPDVREFDSDFVPSMVTRHEGEYLVSYLQKTGGQTQGRLVPVACVEQPKNIKTDKFCLPVSQEERDFEDGLHYGGVVKVKPGNGAGEEIEVDFLSAHFGHPIPKDDDLVFNLFEGDGCEALGEAANVAKNVIIKRGGCSFHEKTLFLTQAGVENIVIVNNEAFPDRPGVLDKWSAYNITSGIVMVGSQDGKAMWEAAKSSEDGTVSLSFAADNSVRDDMYHKLALLVRKAVGEEGGFPFKKKRRKELMAELKKEMEGAGVSKGLWDAFAVAAEKGGVKV